MRYEKFLFARVELNLGGLLFLVCASLRAGENQIRVSADFGLLTWTCGYNRTVNGRALRDFARDRSRCHEQNPNKLFSFACARSSVRPPHLISR